MSRILHYWIVLLMVEKLSHIKYDDTANLFIVLITIIGTLIKYLLRWSSSTNFVWCSTYVKVISMRETYSSLWCSLMKHTLVYALAQTKTYIDTHRETRDRMKGRQRAGIEYLLWNIYKSLWTFQVKFTKIYSYSKSATI